MFVSVVATVIASRSASELPAFFDELEACAERIWPELTTTAYGDDPAQVLDLRLPGGGGPFPVAFVLHGGFWRAPYTRRNTAAVAAALTAAGWATANVEYRRLGPGSYRAMLEDVAAARAHLDTVVDVDRVTAVGHSAGGHLALWLASRGGADAVLGLAAVCDLGEAAREGLGDNATQEFLGDDPEAYELADPARRLPLGVPQLLAHGTADDRVPFGHAERYAERAGEECAVLRLDGVDHFDVIDPRTDAWRRIMGAL
jgi:acetyl esterase/lipase